MISHDTRLNGQPPAQADMLRSFRLSPSTAHQNILDLEVKGLFARTPGKPRSLPVLFPPQGLPELFDRGPEAGGVPLRT